MAAQLRENGIDDVRKVKSAMLESEGTVSVIPAEDPPEQLPDDAEFAETVERFASAAEAVRAVIARHEERAKAARELLAKHGVIGPARPRRPNKVHHSEG